MHFNEGFRCKMMFHKSIFLMILFQMPMFSGLEVGCHVGCMSFGAFFNTEDITKIYQPVFGTDQCGVQDGFGMYLRNDTLYADVAGWTSAGVTVGIPYSTYYRIIINA